MYTARRSASSKSEPYVQAAVDWVLASWTLSVASQLTATLLLCCKLRPRVHTSTGQSRTAVIRMVVESGALVALNTVLVLAFYARRAEWGPVFGNALGQVSVRRPALCRLYLAPVC